MQVVGGSGLGRATFARVDERYRVKVLFRHVVVACCALLLSACATPSLRPGGGITPVEATDLPAPARTDLMSAEQPYYIGPFDEVTIDVFGVDELSKRDVQVDASGRLEFPLVGTVEAGGKTPMEISKEIEAGLRRRFMRAPHVTVNLKKTVSQVVTVGGEVREPGLYPVIGRTSLLRSIATAKGTTEFAKLQDVVIFRTVRGQKYAALYNLKAIRSGVYADPEVYANDVIMVGEARSRRIFRDLLQVVPLLTYPLVVAIQK